MGLILITIAAGLGDQVLATSPSPPRAPIRVPASELELPRSEHRDLPRERRGPLGEAGGAVPEGTTVLDDGIPGVANLDPALRAAVRQAATDAAQEGITLRVDSGWRSATYQRHLLDEAIAKHGSEREAARWVALPDRSAHVSGEAVDIGPSAAAAWLSERGAGYGLCQIYANEPWHFELRPRASVQGCPPTYPDPTHDPRLQP